MLRASVFVRVKAADCSAATPESPCKSKEQTMSRQEGKKVLLVLDSGVHCHCVSDPNLLHDLQLHETPDQHIWSNGQNFPILGRGSLQTDQFKVTDVLYVPGLPINVISTSMLCEIGYYDYIVSFGWMRRFGLWLYLRLAQLITSYKKDNAILPMDQLTGEDGRELEKSSKTQPSMFGLSRLSRNLKQDENSRYHVYCTSDLVGNASYKRRKIENARNKQCMIHFFVDSGACFHITRDSSILQPYPSHLNVKSPIQFITGVSGSEIEVKGVGYIDHAGLRLDGVLFVPDASENLVSFGQLLAQYPSMEGVFANMMITFMEGSWWWCRECGKSYRLGSNHFVLDYFRPGHQYIDNLMQSVQQSSGTSEDELMAHQCVPMEE